MKSRWKWFAAVLTAILAVAGLAGCGSSSGDGKLKDKYTVVSDTSFVPFEFKEDNKYVGFDIDLIHAIAEDVGFEIDFKTTNFDGIIPGLQTSQFDIALAGIGITDERAKKIDYSDAYYESGLKLAVKKDNDDIKGLDDLDGKKVATRLGSTSSQFIKKEIKGATPKEYEQLDQAYLAVENGSVDAILYDAPNVAYYIKTKGDSLKMVGDLYQAEKYGIAFSKDQDGLVKAVDKSLKKLRDNGKYDEIYEKWFGKKPE